MYFGADAADLAPRLVKGVRIYCEGNLRLDQWESQDGKPRSGLSVMSFFIRVAAIGANKPPRERRGDDRVDDRAAPLAGAGDFNDEIPF
jgi:single-stranded DNA-binding protein